MFKYHWLNGALSFRTLCLFFVFRHLSKIQFLICNLLPQNLEMSITRSLHVTRHSLKTKKSDLTRNSNLRGGIEWLTDSGSWAAETGFREGVPSCFRFGYVPGDDIYKLIIIHNYLILYGTSVLHIFARLLDLFADNSLGMEWALQSRSRRRYSIEITILAVTCV